MARRPRAARDYRRRGPVREPYDVVLIVCEGEKTEPTYFQELRRQLRLSSANVRVVPAELGNDPVSVVRYAEDEDRRSRQDYDSVFCVFDRDDHPNFDEALELILHSQLGDRITAVPSVPCFELWVLLHFEYSSAPYRGGPRRSACDQVISQVKRFLPGYDKALEGIFEKLWPRTEVAARNGRRLEAENRKTGTDNPATYVHHLVQYLLNIRAST